MFYKHNINAYDALVRHVNDSLINVLIKHYQCLLMTRLRNRNIKCSLAY